MDPRPPVDPPYRHWDSTLAPLIATGDQRLWRAHSDATNARLVERWLPEGRVDDILKTDLYDEAMGEGLAPVLVRRATRVTAVDVAPSVTQAARRRHPTVRIAACDIRRLPFRDASFDVVVSNSTLDHFERRDDIGRSLAELHRTLKPGGWLLVTLDNLRHPAVALRNALPFRLLRALRLADYPAGATLGPRTLVGLLGSVGFDVHEVTALLHCPRPWAVARARRLQRREDQATHARFLSGLARWESLGGLPTRFLTGHYTAVRARKPHASR
ncbi:MAG: class I SAM-dependent methyltransferase [Burkholderiales bacterium]